MTYGGTCCRMCTCVFCVDVDIYVTYDMWWKRLSYIYIYICIYIMHTYICAQSLSPSLSLYTYIYIYICAEVHIYDTALLSAVGRLKWSRWGGVASRRSVHQTWRYLLSSLSLVLLVSLLLVLLSLVVVVVVVLVLWFVLVQCYYYCYYYLFYLSIYLSFCLFGSFVVVSFSRRGGKVPEHLAS